jgi:hypothetical protein
MLQHPVPEKLLIRIGDVTVSFALLESTIQVLIGSLISEHQRIGQIITAEVAFKNLRALAISLYKERHGEDGDFVSLRGLMTRAGQLEEKRNQIMHSVWAVGSSTDTVTRIKTTAKEKHGVRFHFEDVAEQDLAEVANDLKRLGEDVELFWIKLLSSGKAVNSPVDKKW